MFELYHKYIDFLTHQLLHFVGEIKECDPISPTTNPNPIQSDCKEMW